MYPVCIFYVFICAIYMLFVFEYRIKSDLIYLGKRVFSDLRNYVSSGATTLSGLRLFM